MANFGVVTRFPPGVARERESRVAAVPLYAPVGSDLSPLAPLSLDDFVRILFFKFFEMSLVICFVTLIGNLISTVGAFDDCERSVYVDEAAEIEEKLRIITTPRREKR